MCYLYAFRGHYFGDKVYTILLWLHRNTSQVCVVDKSVALWSWLGMSSSIISCAVCAFLPSQLLVCFRDFLLCGWQLGKEQNRSMLDTQKLERRREDLSLKAVGAHAQWHWRWRESKRNSPRIKKNDSLWSLWKWKTKNPSVFSGSSWTQRGAVAAEVRCQIGCFVFRFRFLWITPVLCTKNTLIIREALSATTAWDLRRYDMIHF